MANHLDLPNLGLGLGLRHQHFDFILRHQPPVDWFEIISENFMDSGGRPRYVLRQIAERYPIVMHGVSLSIGSTDPLNFEYLKRLKRLADETQAVWVSDHLCWTGILGINSHDLLPVPLNEESLKHVCQRIDRVQSALERPLVIENPSTYLTFQQSTIPEYEFLNAIVTNTGCGLLLDVNNVYVSGYNNDFDPVHYIESINAESVIQMHLAGHQHCGDHIIDTHDREVADYVWELFRLAWQRTGGTSTLLEWDGNIPDFERCHAELQKALDFIDQTAAAGSREPDPPATTASVSNPVDFLVSDTSPITYGC